MTVSDGVGVGEPAGWVAGVELGAPGGGCGDPLLLLESGTVAGSGAGVGEACAFATESGAAAATVSPAFAFEPEHAEPNATAVVSVAERRSRVI
jgi:hypothetical protein